MTLARILIGGTWLLALVWLVVVTLRDASDYRWVSFGMCLGALVVILLTLIRAGTFGG